MASKTFDCGILENVKHTHERSKLAFLEIQPTLPALKDSALNETILSSNGIITMIQINMPSREREADSE
jgi:hypothetical protein